MLGDTWGNDPTLKAIDDAAPGIVSVAAANREPWESALDAIVRVAPQIALANNQRRLLDIQLERARTGQAPLDASNFGLGVNVGLSPETQKLIMLGVAGIAAALILPRLLK